MTTTTAIATLSVKGASGTEYQFEVYPKGTNVPAVPGVYLVTKRVAKASGGGSHTYIYIGQAGNVPVRLEDHHKAACFARHSANCICVHRDRDERSRLAKEADLIAAHDPPCNG